MKKFMSVITAVSVIAMQFIPVQITANAEESANIALEIVSAEPGESVDLALTINNNPGIIATSITVEYDTSCLSLTSVEDCELFSGASFTASGKISMNPFRVMWENGLSTSNYTDSGTLAVFHFDVLDEAPYGTSEIQVTVEAENTFDINLDDVEFTASNGAVIIKEAPAATTTVTSTTESTNTTTTTSTTSTTESETTETTTSTTSTSKPETTSMSATMETVEITSTESVTTSGTYFASDAELRDMAKKDYKSRTGIYPDYATSELAEDGFINIYLYDEEGNLFDTYTIDPYSGVGISASGYGIELPHTGNNSAKAIAGSVFAFILMITGAFALTKSGVIGKKRKDE